MSDLLKRLHEQRMAAVKAAREIAERMAATDTPSAEDNAAYEKANVDVDRLGQLAQDERKRVESEQSDADAFAAAERAAGVKNDRQHDAGEKRKAMWTDELRNALKNGEQREGGTFEQLPTPERVRELRALTDPVQITAATHGPETVAETLVERLFVKLFDDSAILRAGPTILRTGTGEALKFPRLTDLGPLAMADARRAEMQQIQKANPTFDQVELNSYKYGQISQASREVIEDSVIDVRGLLGTVIGRNMANYLGFDLTLGDGTDKPRGVATVVPAGNKVTGAAAAPADMDDILDVIAKLNPAYRRNAKFLMNDATTFVLRKFKLNTTTGDNAYAWQPSVVPGGPDTLMGYPVLTDPNMADTGLSALSIIFADFSMYYVRLVNDVRVEWSTEYAWDTDVVSVKAVLRADGDTIDDAAFAGFVGAAA